MQGDPKRLKSEYSILLVDDSPVMRMFIRRVLMLSGLSMKEVFEADDGQVALEMLRTCRVDLILSDINMPRMNGSELMRRLAAAPDLRSIPVIVVSTDSSHVRVESMMKLGARGYLQKPFQPEKLRMEIERVLEL